MQTPIVYIIQDVVSEVSAKVLTSLQAIDNNITAVHYDYGHPSEILARLEAKAKTAKNRVNCYPLIGLFLDFPETTTGRPDMFSEATLHIFICHATINKLTSQERTERKFIPILYPIFEQFLKSILANPYISEKNYSALKYTKTDRYKWGTGGIEYYKDGLKNTFNDFIDAIEITNLKLSFKKEC